MKHRSVEHQHSSVGPLSPLGPDLQPTPVRHVHAWNGQRHRHGMGTGTKEHRSVRSDVANEKETLKEKNKKDI